MTTRSKAEIVEAQDAPRRRSPLQYFLVLVLVNLMWAFQFSGAKIATERLGPGSRCLNSVGTLDHIVCPPYQSESR